MKKNFLYTALFALMLASCSEQEVNNRLPQQGGRKFSFRLMSLPVNC